MAVKNQVPTNEMERELRKLYLRWLGGLDRHEDDVADYIRQFERDSRALITKLGGQAASLGALADFPVPSVLELSPKAGVIYDAMQQAAIKASIAAGLNSTDAARQMLHAGIGKNFNQLNRLARTETVSAYWKNQWDSVAGLPDIIMVWGTEFSSRTCDYCKSRNGLVVEDGDLRDHPNGRCTLIPTLRSKLKYIGTLDAGGGVSYDPKYGKPVAQPTPLPAESQPTPEQRSPLGTKRNPAAPSKAEPVHKSAPNTPQPAPQIPVGRKVDTVRDVVPDKPGQYAAYERGSREYKAMEKYVVNDDATLAMNKRWRAGETINSQKSKDIDYAISQNELTDTVELWRGLALTEEEFAQYAVGREFEWKGWTSTAPSRDTAEFYVGERVKDLGAGYGAYILKLLPKAGTHVGVWPGEIVFERGVKWRVAQIKGNEITLVQY